MSLLEILIAFTILLIAMLTLVGYTTTIHRAASESKRQAIASAEARTLMERIRDFPPLFEDAASASGYTETQTEYLLDTETNSQDNESGNKSAAEFLLEARATHLSGAIYRIVVTATWDEDGRQRQVVLESRMDRLYH